MTYVENFLGLGTVIFNSSVPKGTIYATAKENLVLYYIPVNGADLSEAFSFTSDATGYIGIHEEADYSNLTCEDTVVSGIVLFAERTDGIVVSTITGGKTLGTLTVNSASGTSTGDTKITVTPALGSGNSYKYKIGDTAQEVTYGKFVQTWSAWNGTDEIKAENGKTITIVECDSSYRAVKAGSKVIVSNQG